MELLNNAADRMTGWLSAVSRGSRIAVILILMIVVFVLINSSGLSGGEKMAELLPSGTLRQTDIRRICVALDSAGLAEYRIEDESVLVPAAHRANYLRIIQDQNLLPDDLKPAQPAASRINPFMSRSQQKMIEHEQRKRTVREMVMRLPFVEQAWFEMDSQSGNTVFDKRMQSAVVSVELRNRQCLNQQQLATLRNLVSGALAGFTPDEVVVTDINAGRAYTTGTHVVQTHQKDSAEHDPYYSASWQKEDGGAFDQRAWLESEIRNALLEYNGIEIDVKFQERPVGPGNRSEGRFATLPPEPTRGNRSAQASSMPVMKFGANERATIGEDPAEFFDNASAPDRATIELARGIDSARAMMVSVLVKVPRKTVEQRIDPPSGDGIFGIPKQQGQPDYLQVGLAEIRQEIVSRIDHLVEQSPGLQRENVRVVMSGDSSFAAQVPVRVDIQKFVSRHWANITTLLIGMLLLSIVVRTSRSRPQIVAPDTLSIDSSGARDSDPVESRQANVNARRQLSRLIDENPDKAAQVIKSWIRDAA